jgi:hypothetical protein
MGRGGGQRVYVGHGNLSIKELRDLENLSATFIQKMVRSFFTRKWYLNYILRKRLGMPFSGIEFA